MGSGKTAALLKTYSEAAESERLMVKHRYDNRFGSFAETVVSRDGCVAVAVAIEKLENLHITERFAELKLICVDEGHFFDDVSEYAALWARNGKKVVVTGVSRDIFFRPLANMSKLIAQADQVTFLTAKCNHCHGVGGFNYRATAFPDTDNRVLKYVGGDVEYITLCRPCFYKRMKDDIKNCAGMFSNANQREIAQELLDAELQLPETIL